MVEIAVPSGPNVSGVCLSFLFSVCLSSYLCLSVCLSVRQYVGLPACQARGLAMSKGFVLSIWSQALGLSLECCVLRAVGYLLLASCF